MPVSLIPMLLRAKSMASGIMRWIGKNPLLAVCLLLAGAGLLEHHEAIKWRTVADQRGNALSAVKTAQAEAIKQATIAKEAADAKNARLAVASDQAAADLRSRYDAAVMQLAAAQRAPRRPDLPIHAETPQSSDRPGEGADVPANAVAITTADALTCADNTARLQAVHDWAEGLGSGE